MTTNPLTARPVHTMSSEQINEQIARIIAETDITSPKVTNRLKILQNELSYRRSLVK